MNYNYLMLFFKSLTLFYIISAMYDAPADKKDTFMEPPSAILAPSSVTHRTSPQVHVRHRELDPAAADTGKDTQKLVEEDC